MARLQFKYNLKQMVASPDLQVLGRKEQNVFNGVWTQYYLSLDGGLARLTVTGPIDGHESYAWIDAYNSDARQVVWTHDVKYDAQLFSRLDHIYVGHARADIRADLVWEAVHGISDITPLDALWQDKNSYYFIGTSGQAVRALVLGTSGARLGNHLVIRDGIEKAVRYELSAPESQILRPIMRNVLARHTK